MVLESDFSRPAHIIALYEGAIILYHFYSNPCGSRYAYPEALLAGYGVTGRCVEEGQRAKKRCLPRKNLEI